MSDNSIASYAPIASIALALIMSLLSLSSCSIYRSPGRKFLESSLPTIGIEVASYVQSCDRAATNSVNWVSMQNEDSADILNDADNAAHLRVTPHVDENFHCDFQFENPTQLSHALDAAVAHTFLELNTSRADRAAAP